MVVNVYKRPTSSISMLSMKALEWTAAQGNDLVSFCDTLVY